jgi:hypothetical protein
MTGPFPERSRLSGSDLETLKDWLVANANPETEIAPGYTVGAMISDMEAMLDGMWSDGIDAMGEDA